MLLQQDDLLRQNTHRRFFDDILSITDNLTFLSPQTDILSSILSDREFDSPPFIRILLFLAALALQPGFAKIFKCDTGNIPVNTFVCEAASIHVLSLSDGAMQSGILNLLNPPSSCNSDKNAA